MRHDWRHVGFRLRHADAVAQTPDHAQEAGVTHIPPRIDADDERRDHVNVTDRRDEALGQHADDGVGVSVEDDIRTEYVRCAETPDPEPVADDCDAMAAPFVIVRERTPRRHGRTQHLEEGRRRLHALEPFGFPAGQVGAPLKRGNERLECAGLFADVAEVRN